METWTQEEFWSELEQLGENGVRIRLANKLYSDVNERLAREWLQQKELARAAELERRRGEREAAQLEAAARASAAANTRAAIAIMIAATALVASILSLIAHFLK